MYGQQVKPSLLHTCLLLTCLSIPYSVTLPVSISASILEICLLTLLSHPWSQWLLKQPHPPALLTSVEICTIFDPLGINNYSLGRWSLLRGKGLEIFTTVLLLLSPALRPRHSDQNVLRTVFPQQNMGHCEFNFVNNWEVAFFFQPYDLKKCLMF